MRSRAHTTATSSRVMIPDFTEESLRAERVNMVATSVSVAFFVASFWFQIGRSAFHCSIFLWKILAYHHLAFVGGSIHNALWTMIAISWSDAISFGLSQLHSLYSFALMSASDLRLPLISLRSATSFVSMIIYWVNNLFPYVSKSSQKSPIPFHEFGKCRWSLLSRFLSYPFW